MQQVLLSIVLMMGGLSQEILNKSVILINPAEERLEIEISPEDKFVDVMEWMQSYFQTPGSELEVSLSYSGGMMVRAKKMWRNYEESVTEGEKAKIAHIVKTLAYESLITIGNSRSSIKEMGKEIDHLHPLRFLMTIFSDEELKAGAHAIRGRFPGWLWKEFRSGATTSLKEEFKHKNLTLEQIKNFAKRVKIDEKLLLDFFHQEKWVEFVEALVKEIPREKDPNRYNM